MIYYARALNSGLWKIGCATRPVLRVAQIVSAWREPLVILAATPGSFPEEKELHRRLAPLRAGRRGREWYTDDGTIAALVESLPRDARVALTIQPWARKGGKAPLPVAPAAWRAEAKREEAARFAAKHKHPRNVRDPECPTCVDNLARWREQHARKSPLFFPKLYPRRPYATSQPSEASS